MLMQKSSATEHLSHTVLLFPLWEKIYTDEQRQNTTTEVYSVHTQPTILDAHVKSQTVELMLTLQSL